MESNRTGLEPLWLTEARADIGVREVPGAATAPTIARWLIELKAWWSGDEVPWCGTAVAAWMRAADVALPQHWYRAKAWAEWGQPLREPAHGCVVVFERTGGGHVGLVVGQTQIGDLLVLGGNQGDAVNVRSFPRHRVYAYRWPPGHDIPDRQVLAIGAAPATLTEA